MTISKNSAESESLAGGHVKGGLIRSHLAWVRTVKGDAGVERLMAELGSELSKELKGLLSTTWYPFGHLVEVDKAIERLFGNGQRDFLKVLGKYSADVNLGTTYKIYKREDIHDFFRRSTPLHSQFQDFGRVEYEQLGERASRMNHVDCSFFSPSYCQSALGYYEQAIVIHGGQRPSVRESLCKCRGDHHCSFEMTWS